MVPVCRALLASRAAYMVLHISVISAEVSFIKVQPDTTWEEPDSPLAPLHKRERQIVSFNPVRSTRICKDDTLLRVSVIMNYVVEM